MILSNSSGLLLSRSNVGGEKKNVQAYEVSPGQCCNKGVSDLRLCMGSHVLQGLCNKCCNDVHQYNSDPISVSIV